jgi:hypothetical protein
MITRITFDEKLAHAIRVRGITLTEVAHRANLALATVSAALSGRPVNVTTALRLTRVVSACPIVPELEAWARDPGKSQPVESSAPLPARARADGQTHTVNQGRRKVGRSRQLRLV